MNNSNLEKKAASTMDFINWSANTRAPFVFMCGSSAVGKSTALEEINAMYESGELFPKASMLPEHRELKIVPMAARDVRQLLGSPSWETLIENPQLMFQHQLFIARHYFRVIYEQTVRRDTQTAIHLFERCPLDVIGYTYAFAYEYRMRHSGKSADQALEYAITLHSQIIAQWAYLIEMLKQKVMVTYHRIDPNIPYAINEHRPPESIRNDTGYWLNKFMSKDARWAKTYPVVNVYVIPSDKATETYKTLLDSIIA